MPTELSDDYDPVAVVHELVRVTVRAHPENSDREIAAEVADQLDTAAQRTMLLESLSAWCWTVRRSEQLVVERAAQHERTTAPNLRRAVNPMNQFQTLFDNPAAMYGPPGRESSVYLGNRRDRAAFRRWCGDAFEDWHCRAAAYVEEHAPDKHDLFGGDWHPEGPRAYGREQLADRLMTFVEQYAAEIRLEFTEELLASEFALGDGRRVTWGSATSADHEQRIELLVQNAASNTEAAARHRSAVSTLQMTGCDRLRDLPELASSVPAEVA